MWKCYNYNLRIEYIPTSAGIVIMDEHYNKVVAAGWLDGDTPEKEARMLVLNVDKYLENPDKHQKYYTNEKTKQINEPMKEAGHKLTDFM